MRLIGIMLERWCSSSRASCSVATPGGRSRSSCRNAIRAGCSTTPSTASRAGCARSARPASRRAGRLLDGRPAGAAGRAARRRSPSPLWCSVGATAGIEEAPLRAARAEADEELAAWIEATPIEDVVALWERQPLFADQSDALVEAQRPGRLSQDPRALALLLRTAGQGALEPVWHELLAARAARARDRRRARRRLQPRREADRLDRAERPGGDRGGRGPRGPPAAARSERRCVLACTRASLDRRLRPTVTSSRAPGPRLDAHAEARGRGTASMPRAAAAARGASGRRRAPAWRGRRRASAPRPPPAAARPRCPRARRACSTGTRRARSSAPRAAARGPA